VKLTEQRNGTVMLAQNISIPHSEIQTLCQRYHIRKLAVFGSALHEDFRTDSDIDVLVEFEPGFTPGFDFVRIQNELSALFHRTVDLHTSKSLSKYFREQVMQEAQTLYAKE
jgi:predicted nucleotidyltransferase